jgi:hypothetical protein
MKNWTALNTLLCDSAMWFDEWPVSQSVSYQHLAREMACFEVGLKKKRDNEA